MTAQFMSRQSNKVLRSLQEAAKVSQFLIVCGRLFQTQGAVTKNRRPDRQTHFCKKKQSGGFELTNGACAVVGTTAIEQKDSSAAGLTFVIKNTMFTV